jgi:hypothetical protein
LAEAGETNLFLFVNEKTKKQLQWTPLNRITLGLTINLFNLSQFDHFNQMIPLTVIRLSGAH